MGKIEKLFSELNDKPVVYHSVYARITGSVTAGLLLSQIVYWNKVSGGEFYKTDKEWQEELVMGERELRNAKKKLKELGFVKIKRKGVPAKTYYTLDINRLITVITSSDEKAKPVRTKGPNKNGRKVRTSITENTTENTTENIIGQKTKKFIEKLKKEMEGITLTREQVEELKEFVNYWTEPNRSRTKLRWEMQPTWDMRRRVATWLRRKNQWNNNFKKKGGVLEV